WLKVYDWTLRASLRFHPVTMAVSLALFVGTWYLFQAVPKGFLPSEDQGRFRLSTEAIQGISLEEMTRHQLQVAEIVAKEPSIAQYQIQVGGGGGGGGGGLNTGGVMIELKPRAERNVSVDELIAQLRPKLAQIPGIRAFMVNQPPINLGGQQGARSLYQFTLQDTDTA